MARVILVCGLPGSGKSTLAERLAREQGLVRFNPDQWMADLGMDLFDEDARSRVESLQWQLAMDVLKLGQSVVIENGFWTRSERDELRNYVRRMGFAVELRYLTAPFEELWTRIQRRNAAKGPHTVFITRSQLEGYQTSFEAPDAEELALYDVPEV